jgi:hypothetical protein
LNGIYSTDGICFNKAGGSFSQEYAPLMAVPTVSARGLNENPICNLEGVASSDNTKRLYTNDECKLVSKNSPNSVYNASTGTCTSTVPGIRTYGRQPTPVIVDYSSICSNLNNTPMPNSCKNALNESPESFTEPWLKV